VSGPKVVSIVTREEVLQICRGLLARVDAALEEWVRIGRRNHCVDDEAITAARRRRDALAGVIAADRFMDLQKQAPVEEMFLRDDMHQRLAKVAAEQAAARSKERREREAASALLSALRKNGAALDPELEAGLARGDPAATSRGLLMLGNKRPIKADSALVAQLREEGPPSTFAEWVRAQPRLPEDPSIERIEGRIAEIARLVNAAEQADWHKRLTDAANAPVARRNLILDTLEVETGRALTFARRRAVTLSELRSALAEAVAAGIETTAWKDNLDELTSDEMESRTTIVKAAIETHRSEGAIAARRAAVLKGLGGLGYEVTEGMSTAWASEGRLVLRSATRPDYGVELSGNERFQMRPVAFDANGRRPDPARDRDAETIWCGDVGSLEKRLAELGDGLQIEKALPVGAVPLKRIAVTGESAAAAAEAPVLRERTLR
jgi:hypothetical protein